MKEIHLLAKPNPIKRRKKCKKSSDFWKFSKILATFRHFFTKPSDFQRCTEKFSEPQILMQKNSKIQNFPFKKCKIQFFTGKIWKLSPFWPLEANIANSYIRGLQLAACAAVPGRGIYLPLPGVNALKWPLWALKWTRRKMGTKKPGNISPVYSL